jgi:hypothetical protein
MVLDMDREAAVGRIEARSLGDGPALQRVADLQAQIVMQAPGGVLLDQIGVAAARLRRAALRLGGLGEVALGAVARERAVGT